MTTAQKGQRIGEINGRFAWLFKVLLGVNAVLVVPALGWATWSTLMVFDLRQSLALTTQRYETFMAAGPRYTSKDAERDLVILRAENQTTLAEIKSQLARVTADVEYLRKKLDAK